MAGSVRCCHARHRRPASAQPGGPQTSDHNRLGFPLGSTEKRLVLGVTLPGAPYPEVAETRRRLRYAVLAALHVARYTPMDEKHIGYWRPSAGNPSTQPSQTEVSVFRNDWPGATSVAESGKAFEADLGIGIAIRAAASAAQTGADPAADDAPLPTIVPSEEFDNGQNNHVLVLWLDQDVLTAGGHPIASLIKLHTQNGYPAESKFAVLGPEDSTMLEAMICEKSPPRNADFSVYNFGATAEESEILRDCSNSGGIQSLNKSKIQYYQTVQTDGQLADSLACELMRRDPNLELAPW